MKKLIGSCFAFRSGRRGRKSFIWAHVCARLLLLVMLAALNQIAVHFEWIPKGLLQGLSMASFLVFLGFAYATTAQRCRDIGWSGLWGTVGFIPGVGDLFAIMLAIIPGIAGPNRFGGDPLSRESHLEALLRSELVEKLAIFRTMIDDVKSSGEAPYPDAETFQSLDRLSLSVLEDARDIDIQDLVALSAAIESAMVRSKILTGEIPREMLLVLDLPDRNPGKNM